MKKFKVTVYDADDLIIDVFYDQGFTKKAVKHKHKGKIRNETIVARVEVEEEGDL